MLKPPNITPGNWDDAEFGDPLHCFYNGGGNPVYRITVCGRTQEEADANLEILAAAPAMAEVLAECLNDSVMLCHESYDGDLAPFGGCSCQGCTIARKMRGVLIAAGYTEEHAEA